MKDKKTEIEQNLIQEHAEWKNLYKYGGQDPFWPDGCNLNLIRNHIIHYRKRMEEIGYYPESYYWDVPREVDDNYMTRTEEIRKAAGETLEAMVQNENYQFLMKCAGRLTEKQKKSISVKNIIGYQEKLDKAIQEDDLVTMRRYRNKKDIWKPSKSAGKKWKRSWEKKPRKKKVRWIFLTF